MGQIPKFEVKLGGTKLDDQLMSNVMYIKVAEAMDQLDCFEIVFRLATGGAKKKLLKACMPGGEFSVKLGKAGKEFKGDIHMVTHERSQKGWEVQVTGLDGLERLRSHRDPTIWEEGLKGAIEKIAKDHGMKAKVQGVQSSKALLFQSHEDDLTFVRNKAKAYNYFVRVVDKTLHFGRRNTPYESKGLKLKWEDGIHRMSLTASVKEVMTEVTVTHHNYTNMKEIKGVAKGSAKLKKISGGDDAIKIAKKLFGDRKIYVPNSGAVEVSAAKEKAEAILQGYAETFVKGEITIPGDPNACSGAKLSITDGPWPMTGDYIITETIHVLEQGRGYTTTVKFMSDSLPKKK